MDGLMVGWSADAAGVQRFEVKLGNDAFQSVDLAHGSAIKGTVQAEAEVSLKSLLGG